MILTQKISSSRLSHCSLYALMRQQKISSDSTHTRRVECFTVGSVQHKKSNDVQSNFQAEVKLFSFSLPRHATAACSLFTSQKYTLCES